MIFNFVISVCCHIKFEQVLNIWCFSWVLSWLNILKGLSQVLHWWISLCFDRWTSYRNFETKYILHWNHFLPVWTLSCLIYYVFLVNSFKPFSTIVTLKWVFICMNCFMWYGFNLYEESWSRILDLRNSAHLLN